MTTKILMLAIYVPSVTRRLHKNPARPLPVNCHRYGTAQTLPQAPSSSLGRPGDNLPSPKAKPQQDAEMPISHRGTRPAQQPGTALHCRGAATTDAELSASPWIWGFPARMLPLGCKFTVCRKEAQQGAADAIELPTCTHRNVISGFVSQHSPGRFLAAWPLRPGNKLRNATMQGPSPNAFL